MTDPSLHNAEHLLRQGAIREAEAAARQALELGADPAAAHELLGAVYLELRRPDLAAESAAEAVELDPNREQAYRHLARAHQLMGRRQEALRTLLEAIERLPGALGSYLDAAVLLRDLGGLDEALDILELAARRMPDADWELTHLRLDLLVRDHRYDEAAAAAEATLRERPDDVGALEVLSSARYHLGDLASAIAALGRLLAVAPDLHEYELRLAALLREQGDRPRTVAVLERLVDHAPPEVVDSARESLAVLDAEQIPIVVMMAHESRELMLRLEQDPIAALRERGFALSRAGLAQLVGLMANLDPGMARSQRYH